jgi:hypothetical protein
MSQYQHEWTRHDRTVRVDVETVTTRPPGHRQAWTAEAGKDRPWRADGATEKEALATLTNALREFLAHYRPPTVLTFRSYVAVVSLDTGDSHNPIVWRQEVFHRDRRFSSSSGGGGSWEAAEAHARHNLAQASTDWHNDDSVREAAAYLEGGQRFGHGEYGPDEFLRYAAWQRAAKAAMAAGRDDWHEWAHQHRNEYTIPPAEAVA